MLSLGSVTFAIDELPERIRFGGTHAVAVRKYPGGFVDVQTLGAFDDNLSWDGCLWFTDALARARALNTLRLHADPVLLQLGTLHITVVVSRFTFDYENDFRIPYQIECTPTQRLHAVQG